VSVVPTSKHDRRTAPRPDLFISTSILQEQSPQDRKTVLGSNPDEDVFCISVTKQDRRTTPRRKLVVSVRKLHKQMSQHRKIVLGSSPGENAFETGKLSTIEEWSLHKLFWRADHRKKSHKPENCPGFETRRRWWV
jgi:hypothetical protein